VARLLSPLPGIIRSAFAKRLSGENSCERFEKKLVLCVNVIRRLLQEVSDWRSDPDKANLRSNLPAIGRFI
jgi:hypothetical protein